MYIILLSPWPAVEGQGKILLVANDERTCYQLREVSLHRHQPSIEFPCGVSYSSNLCMLLDHFSRAYFELDGEHTNFFQRYFMIICTQGF